MKSSSNSNVDGGIARRRGQSSTTKSVKTSILLSLGAFVLVSALFLLSANLSPIKDNDATTYEKDSPPVSTESVSKGSIRNPQNKLRNNVPLNADELLIMRGELHLVDIDASRIRTTKDGYDGGKAFFCKLDWNAYKKDPPSLPMFRFLVSQSG